VASELKIRQTHMPSSQQQAGQRTSLHFAAAAHVQVAPSRRMATIEPGTIAHFSLADAPEQSSLCRAVGAELAHRNGERTHSAESDVIWTELLAQAADSAPRAQLVLDSALAALADAGNAALDAEVTAQLLTPSGLCAVLDAYGVRVPGEVAARVTWRSTPQPSRARERTPMPQELQIAKQSAF
jgi:hypothetical protein